MFFEYSPEGHTRLTHLQRLSFYKELLEGETHNYIHLRASAEETNVLVALQRLSEEVLQTAETIKRLSSGDPLVARTLQSYVMVIQFFINT